MCRHTLLRPRDLMTIGERLAALRPEERRDEYRLKEAVNHAATEIAHEYLAEIAPHTGDLDLERFLRRLPGHVLTRQEVENLFEEHSAEAGSSDDKHVFCAMYRAGLVGYVHYDRIRGASVQRFLRPGESTLEADGVLPRATRYLMHPVLSDVIGRINPGYLERIDRVNIAGYGRPWREAESVDRPIRVGMLCVLKADVKGFSTLMRTRADAPVRKALEDAVQKWGHGAEVIEARDGDAVMIVHADPVALAQMARQIMDDVYQAPGRPRLRIALHHGEVQTHERDGDLAAVIAGGDAVLCVARVEPYVEPGQIWATEEFRHELSQKPSLWRTTSVPGRDGGDRFNVKKRGQRGAGPVGPPVPARASARSVVLARPLAPALHVRSQLLAREPPPVGARRRRRLHPAAGRRKRSPDDIRHLGPRVLEIARLVARRLARHHELTRGVEPVSSQGLESSTGAVGQALHRAEVDAQVDLGGDLVHVLAPRPRGPHRLHGHRRRRDAHGGRHDDGVAHARRLPQGTPL